MAHCKVHTVPYNLMGKVICKMLDVKCTLQFYSVTVKNLEQVTGVSKVVPTKVCRSNSVLCLTVPGGRKTGSLLQGTRYKRTILT